MSRVFDSAWVIARRDFVATVWSRSFILFLLAPVLAMGFGLLLGQTTSRADVEARNPVVAVTTDAAATEALLSARARLGAALGDTRIPRFERVAVAENPRAQAMNLLADPEGSYSAVLSGTLDNPVLVGPRGSIVETLDSEVMLILDDARRAAAIAAAGTEPAPVSFERVVSERAAGAAQWGRRSLARIGQFTIFFITLMLGSMLLSNLVEEKSNKVIEVLAAAVPLDAIFLGKLIGMLGVSVLGLSVWAGAGFAALQFAQQIVFIDVAPAVGWFAYALLLVLYFSTNYMLLGAVFLGIGGQATSVREVQTLNMPIVFMQVLVFLLASLVVAEPGGWTSWAAILFPLSSPLAMIALAAQQDSLWIHIPALLWQALWVVIIIRISARLFRKTVLQSSSRLSFFEEFAFWRN
jgi:ABC-2 type transport system permease protein